MEVVKELKKENIVVNLRSMVGKYPITDDEWQAIENAIKIVNSHRTGKWIDEKNEDGCCLAICSSCGVLEQTGWFCRNCGSDNSESFRESFKIRGTTGEWNWSGSNGKGRNYYNCSVCGRLIEATRAELIKFPYCHCGAQMEVKKEKLAYEK